jgi:AraC-like DNA-binding protein
MISLEYETPSTDLVPLISSFYRFEYHGAPTGELERADRAQFRFYLNGQSEYRFAKGNTDSGHPVTIVGPTSAPCTTWAQGNVTIFGWGITPAGWAALMGTQAGHWTDRAFDAQIIFGEPIMKLHHTLSECSDLKDQVALAQQAAREIYRNVDTAPFEFTSIVDNWLVSSPDPAINDLTAATGLSVRQLERTTRRFYGMPPKMLSRKYRALRAAHILASGDSLDDSSLAFAFYDQSHLIREVKQFTGLTPSQLKSGASLLTDATIRGRSDMRGKVDPLISES